MNAKEALRALQELAASPATKWIGNRVEGVTLLQRCMRCGVEESMDLPPGIRRPVDVPITFDAKLFAWKRQFQLVHERCPPTAVDNEFDQGSDE